METILINFDTVRLEVKYSWSYTLFFSGYRIPWDGHWVMNGWWKVINGSKLSWHYSSFGLFSSLTATNKFKKKYYIYISLNILLGVSVFVHEKGFLCDAIHGQKTLGLHLVEWNSINFPFFSFPSDNDSSVNASSSPPGGQAELKGGMTDEGRRQGEGILCACLFSWRLDFSKQGAILFLLQALVEPLLPPYYLITCLIPLLHSF